ncbi:MAG: universal stress protein [Deltaproteobacteria bacterium]|nr:universal stress protein [Deltaproteobacteria bacterium]
MTKYKILIPYNFTREDQKTLNFVIWSYSGRRDVTVTLFHTYTPLPEIDVRENPQIQRMMGGVTYLTAELRDREKELNAAGEYLMEKGFSKGSVDYVFKKKSKSNADQIVKAAYDGEYNMVVLSRKTGKISQLFSRSVHNKVLAALKNTIVCIAT